MSQSPHILVVDSDQRSRSQLHACLRGSGYRVTAVEGGHGMRRVLDRSRVDLIVLDVQLRGEDGLTLCRDVRGRAQIPVMILSHLNDEIDRIIGLEIGADDYVPKPFDSRELVSRAKAILRCTLNAARSPLRSSASAYRFASWHLDTAERLLRHADGSRVELTEAEFRLLMELIAEAPRPLSRARLLQRLCGKEFHPADRSMDVRISRLRHLLRDDARTPTVIKTMHGKGYAIAVGVVRC